MKQPEVSGGLGQRIEDWVWDCAATELEELQPEVAAWLARERIDLCRLLAEQSDETLALAVSKGFFETAAFAELFRNRYEQRLFRWFRRWGAEQNAVFDLTQEVFLKFRRNGLRSYNPDWPFGSYVYTAAHNLWVAQEYRRRRPVLADHLDSHPAPGGVVEEVERREAEARLGAALARLPADLRTVAELLFEGVSADEAARRLGTTVKRIYGRAHRARRRLAEALGIDRPRFDRGRKPKKDPTRPADRPPQP
jgi:RNA polymerase sigma-70 factor (ECF subfamily)